MLRSRVDVAEKPDWSFDMRRPFVVGWRSR